MDNYTELKELINNSERIVFFGGAGVSTESGIPDFRGNGGLYGDNDLSGITPEEILHRNYFLTHTKEFYSYYKSNMIYPYAEPNGAHRFLKKLEDEGKLQAVITQNIDGLHTLAGNNNVIELHGSVHRNYCMSCGRKYGLDKILEDGDIPRCDSCGGIVKPDVVLYGESLDNDAWTRAEEAIDGCDLLIVAGTSLTVYPAAGLVAGFYGEHLVIINKTPTPYDGLAQLIINDPVGEVFESIYYEA